MVLLKHLYIVANALSTVTIEDSDCPSVSYPGLNVGTVTDPKVDEASGLVASQFNPGVFWTLNDSEGPSCLYALAVNGSLLHTMCLEGAINYDWEAISTAPCDDKKSAPFCLYVGDIGDNRHERSEISIYRVKEPMIDFSQSTESITSNWQSYALKYSDNQRYNAESMLIDAKTRELLIITKGKLPPYAKVFKTQLDTKPETVGILEDTDIRLTLPEATDASASADGQVVMIRLYVGAFLWPRRPRPEHYKMVDILREEECLTSVGMQRQGESVALNPLGVKYFTHSEFVNQSIWEYAIL